MRPPERHRHTETRPSRLSIGRKSPNQDRRKRRHNGPPPARGVHGRRVVMVWRARVDRCASGSRAPVDSPSGRWPAASRFTGCATVVGTIATPVSDDDVRSVRVASDGHDLELNYAGAPSNRSAPPESKYGRRMSRLVEAKDEALVFETPNGASAIIPTKDLGSIDTRPNHLMGGIEGLLVGAGVGAGLGAIVGLGSSPDAKPNQDKIRAWVSHGFRRPEKTTSSHVPAAQIAAHHAWVPYWRRLPPDRAQSALAGSRFPCRRCDGFDVRPGLRAA